MHSPRIRKERKQKHIRYGGALIGLPDSEAAVWCWLDGVSADPRMDKQTKYDAATMAGLMVRAIRTGEGVVLA